MNVNEILNFLKQLGVQNVVCAPGGRCKELLNAFVKDPDFKTTTVYDERTGSFYALGLSFERPTVVLTTSGTAVTELSSAMAEAHHQKGSKLIALTADRPLEIRNTGAPQSMNQNNIFKNFARSFVDLTQDTNDLKNIDVDYPIHINVCMEEPNPVTIKDSNKNYGSLIIASELTPKERSLVIEELKDYEGLLVLEPLSNLSLKDFPKAKVIPFSESFLLSRGLNAFSSVVRLGGVPVFKPWREVESAKAYYWSNASDFSGGIGVEALKLEDVKSHWEVNESTLEIYNEIDKHKNKVEKILKMHSQSEVGLLSALSKFINDEDEVFVGNSLPIREWDFVQKKNFNLFGQRGINGIDGSLAFALGKLDPKKTNWIVLGDLTSLYNFNDFQLIEKFEKRNIRIVVVNNYGGQIFSRVIKENTESFLNSHRKSFDSIAKFWGLKYLNNEFDFTGSKILLELNPNKEASDSFWKELG